MIREGKVDMIYTMRSCDFLTHFAIDVALALMMQNYVANTLERPTGRFTHFIGSLHSYAKDMKAREIF
jgi:thymidylate synthase